jgi:hypothetical protein
MAKVHERKIEIRRDAGSIAGTLIRPAGQLPGVLFVHGWGGSQEQYLARAREICALGAVCLTFDLGGHAGTQPQRETVSRSSNLADLIAAFDTLQAHPQVDAERIAVVGSSYGGYLAAILTTLRGVRWLALRVPALYPDAGWDLPKLQLHREHDLPTYRNSIVSATRNRALAACARFEGDVLVVESERDERIPHAVITSYREACIHVKSLTYRVLDDADHGLTTPASQQAYTEVLMRWLGELWPDARKGSDKAAIAAAISDATERSAEKDHAPEAPLKETAPVPDAAPPAKAR